jgi:hypothetical protein
VGSIALNPKTEAQLAEAVAKYHYDPLGFVLFAYPWGEEFLPDGTINFLKDAKGPEKWQRELLTELGKHITLNAIKKTAEIDISAWRSSIASGNGVGKSALVVFLIHFFMATRPDTRVVVTANTAPQLETRTWPELAKWHNVFICKQWFTWTATSYYFSVYPEERRKNYMATALTVAEDNSVAFQGWHNAGKSLIFLFDEASGIGKPIWEAVDGSMMGKADVYFFAFGNPNEPSGEFYNCFTDQNYVDKYYLRNIDSRDVNISNKEEIKNSIDKWGIDSNWVKIRVFGQFPAQGFNGFINAEMVDLAIRREIIVDYGEPLILGVDVARYGDDSTVFSLRRGRDFRTHQQLQFRGLSTVKVAELVMQTAELHRVDGIVIESTGVGAGVIDVCRDRGCKIVEVHPGSPALEPLIYVNKRAELWGKMRDWIYNEGCMPNDPELVIQMTSIQYGFDVGGQRLKLERKELYKQRTGLPSPDKADSLATTFAHKFARKDRTYGVFGRNNKAVTDDGELCFDEDLSRRESRYDRSFQ